MTDLTKLLLSASVAALLAGAATAQNTAFDNQDAADDRFEDLTDDIDDDFNPERDAFGNEGRVLGFYGSLAGRATATSGNTENFDIGIGSKFGYFDGTNGHEVTLSYSYGEEDSEASQDSLLASYEYNRSFTERFYGFVKGQVAYDQFSSFETDSFVGFGVGYRVIDTNTTTWAIQGGPGYRFAELEDGTEIDEAAVSVSSNFYYELTPTVFFTMDTDVLASDADTNVTNDAGVTVSMTDSLALRSSILTEYHTDPQDGFEDTDNTVGMSLIYSFN